MQVKQQSVVCRCASPGRCLQHEASADRRRDERRPQWRPHLEKPAQEHLRSVRRQSHFTGERLSLYLESAQHNLRLASAVGERLQTSVQHYAQFSFVFSTGKEKIPLGTQVITFFCGECVGPGPVRAVCSHRQWVSACCCTHTAYKECCDRLSYSVSFSSPSCPCGCFVL